jgi:putative Mg2+ transporter-C (MgtC) family protein
MVQMFLDWLLSETNLKLFSAAFLGAMLGFERELSGKDPSLRTFALISVGSCLFAIASSESLPGQKVGDPFRIAAQVVSGIGFLGAGVIFRSRHRVHGLTTAALMWMTAAIGLCVGMGRSDVAYSGTIIALILIVALRGVHHVLNQFAGDKERPVVPDDNRIE